MKKIFGNIRMVMIPPKGSVVGVKPQSIKFSWIFLNYLGQVLDVFKPYRVNLK